MLSTDDTKSFTCVCGKTYSSPQAFNGHKGHCKAHLVTKYGEAHYADYCVKQLKKTQKAIEGRKASRRLKKIQEELEWKAINHYCERCGSQMLEKYGSGRFCSKSCANSKQHSMQTRSKISASAKSTRALKHEQAVAEKNSEIP